MGNEKKVAFKLIGERHGDMWIDGVQLNVKELLIYLIKIWIGRKGACKWL
jgi:hypothetical protein